MGQKVSRLLGPRTNFAIDLLFILWLMVVGWSWWRLPVQPRASLATGHGPCSAMCISANGQRLVTAHQGCLVVWDLVRHQEVAMIADPREFPSRPIFRGLVNTVTATHVVWHRTAVAAVFGRASGPVSGHLVVGGFAVDAPQYRCVHHPAKRFSFGRQRVVLERTQDGLGGGAFLRLGSIWLDLLPILPLDQVIRRQSDQQQMDERLNPPGVLEEHRVDRQGCLPLMVGQLHFVLLFEFTEQPIGTLRTRAAVVTRTDKPS